MVHIKIINEDKVYKDKRCISLIVSPVVSWITKEQEVDKHTLPNGREKAG